MFVPIRRTVLRSVFSSGHITGWGAVQQRARYATEEKEGKDVPIEEEHGPTDETPKDPKDQKIEELTKSLAYSLAEAENARKIAMKDVESARKYALKSFAKELLEVADNLDRALSSIKPEQVSEPVIQSLHKGVEMTNHSLGRVLEKNGVTKQKVQPGDEFDPQLHEALFNIPPTETSTPNTVGQIVKIGWDYKDRVLRPSQVGVYSG